MEDPADFVSTTHGRPVTYRHHDGGVAVISGEAERSIAFSDVTHVRLARLGMMHICELRLRDGSALTVTNEDPVAREAYAGFVRRLHAQLAACVDVTFIHGSWLLVGLTLAVTGVVWAVALAVGLGWIVVPAPVADKAAMIRGVAVVSVVTAPVLAWIGRPRRYDPSHPPAQYQ